jgi:biotin carboxyl carrier protein
MSERRRPGKRAYLLITVFALLLVLFPFLFWYTTWFGRKLSDDDIDRYFADTSKPRRAQHALVQIGERMSRRQDVSRWYPKIVEESRSSSVELRQTAAWLMGQDRGYAPFHPALLTLLRDPQPMVRRNAALSLAASGETAARPELLSMLQPFTVTARTSGAVKYRLKPGDYVNPGTLIAHIGDTEVRSPVPGEVRSLAAREAASVSSGDALVDLGADKNHVWEALRALYIVGGPEDVEPIERFARPVPGMPETVARQAELTLQRIRSRNEEK